MDEHNYARLFFEVILDAVDPSRRQKREEMEKEERRNALVEQLKRCEVLPVPLLPGESICKKRLLLSGFEKTFDFLAEAQKRSPIWVDLPDNIEMEILMKNEVRFICVGDALDRAFGTSECILMKRDASLASEDVKK